MRYKLLIAAGRIPDGATVTKRTGQAPYILRRSVMLYRCDGTAESVSAGKAKMPVASADDGTVLLITERGNINACSASTELVWSLDEHELRDLLDGEAK